MSTENQRYSTENQADANAQYATRWGFEIVRTYADHGKSGLRLEGRDALRQLLSDVHSGNAGFKAILVYDVSRWGRLGGEASAGDLALFKPWSCHAVPTVRSGFLQRAVWCEPDFLYHD
jgi:DNA invertase Pin-like site-specific DNA recombinase